LEIKDADIRILTLKQCRDAVDKGIHAGGAFSTTIPLVALYYGGAIECDIADPTERGQDMFVLSKGHAVAPMASIYADLGYFDRSVLINSRSQESILNGHPGPILPGVHISTGPLGQGLAVAQGFALAGKKSPNFDVFCITGDGELQEGPIWEAVMFSSYKKLDNLCVMVDKNAGQLDDTKQLIFPLLDLERRLAAFGWRVFNVDGTQYGPVVEVSGWATDRHYLPDEEGLWWFFRFYGRS
jgi:transketolase N-terminal domain/subunit